MNNPEGTKSPLSCEEVRDLLFLLATNDIDDASATELYQHLTGCMGCREAMAEHVKVAAALFGVLSKKPRSVL